MQIFKHKWLYILLICMTVAGMILVVGLVIGSKEENKSSDSFIYKTLSEMNVEIPTTAIEAYISESTAAPEETQPPTEAPVETQPLTEAPVETQPPTTVPAETQPPTTELSSMATADNGDDDIEWKLLNKALDYYKKISGNNEGTPAAMLDGINGDIAVIRIYYDGPEAITTADWYTVDIYTGRGTDFWGNNIAIYD